MQSPDELMGAARAQTGLDDFGEDSFREGLDRLVRSLREEATLNDMGEVVLPYLITNQLAQRLQVEDWYRRHPEIDDEPVEAPLIGLGLPRTGSTALSFLLAEDPNARSLRRWEAADPCPPPSTVEGPDPRIDQAIAAAAAQDEMAPRLAGLVPSTPTGPEECQDLMALSFRSHYYQAFARHPVVLGLAARRRPDDHLRLRAAGPQAPPVGRADPAVAAQVPVAPVVARRARPGVPGRPLCHDPPRPDRRDGLGG